MDKTDGDVVEALTAQPDGEIGVRRKSWWRSMTEDEVQREIADHAAWLQLDYARERADFYRVYLRGADLDGALLSEAILSHAMLCDAKLRGARLQMANMRSAFAAQADLTCADLRWSDMTECVLFGAKLTDADLTGAKLDGASMRGADLTGAILHGTCIDPRAPIPYVEDWCGLEVLDGWVYGDTIRMVHHYVAPMNSGDLLQAEFFSVSPLAHKMDLGFVLYPRDELRRKLPRDEWVRVRARASDVHYAGGKIIAKSIEVIDRQNRKK